MNHQNDMTVRRNVADQQANQKIMWQRENNPTIEHKTAHDGKMAFTTARKYRT